MTELSYFEQLSTQTPKKTPYAIMIGTVVTIIVLWLMSVFAPSEGVKDLRNAQEKQEAPAAAAMPAGEDVDL